MITFDYYGRKTSIFLKDIHYITSFGHDISIVCDQETYTYRSSLKDALKLIDSPIVIQVHRSYAVSMMYIKEVDKNMKHVLHLEKNIWKNSCFNIGSI